MATIKPGGNRRRSPYVGGRFLMRTWKGQLIAQSWPRKRGTSPLPYQRAANERMRLAQRMNKRVSPNERATMEQGLKRFLSKHVGIQGLAAIRLRDWLTQVHYGRAFRIEAPDGTLYNSAAVIRDASDFLDMLDPTIGSLLTRTDDAWLPTFQCKPGKVLQAIGSHQWPGACQPAQHPNTTAAIGGYALDQQNHEPLYAPVLPEGGEAEEVPGDSFEREYLQLWRNFDDPNAAWHIDAGALHVTAGQAAILLRTDTNILDGFVDCTLSQADDDGVVMRSTTTPRYYLWRCWDNSASILTSLIQMYVGEPGNHTLLGEATIDFPRGEQHTLRLEANGSTIRGLYDGVELVSVEDEDLQAAGFVGIRHSHHTAAGIYHAVNWG